MALPVRRLTAQQLHVGPQHGVEKGVRATEPDLHDGGWGDVGVAVFLEPGDQAGQGGPHVRRAGGTDHLREREESCLESEDKSYLGHSLR